MALITSGLLICMRFHTLSMHDADGIPSDQRRADQETAGTQAGPDVAGQLGVAGQAGAAAVGHAVLFLLLLGLQVGLRHRLRLVFPLLLRLRQCRCLRG